MFSIITMASSTTKPVAIVSAIRLEFDQAVARFCIAPQVPIQRDMGTDGLSTVATCCQKVKSPARYRHRQRQFHFNVKHRMPVVRSLNIHFQRGGAVDL
jgi:hypothetical protein